MITLTLIKFILKKFIFVLGVIYLIKLLLIMGMMVYYKMVI